MCVAVTSYTAITARQRNNERHCNSRTVGSVVTSILFLWKGEGGDIAAISDTPTGKVPLLTGLSIML
jgi:hypothetical protein